MSTPEQVFAAPALCALYLPSTPLTERLGAGAPAAEGLAALPAVNLQGSFEERLWPGVPGPFYVASSSPADGQGPLLAPNHVALDADGCEHVFRQPGNLEELAVLVGVARNDPRGAWGADGNLHWDLASIRAWWARRQELRARIERDRDARPPSIPRVAYLAGLRTWRWFLEGDLASYLSWYAFCLEEGRAPDSGASLPSVD